MKTKQTIRLLCYLQSVGGITPLEAWTELGIYRLASRIFDLKRDGHNILQKMVTVKNKYGEKFTVARYELKKAGELF